VSRRSRGDAALAALVAERDLAAWAELYDRYAPSVYALAAHTLGRDNAEEVVQDAFLTLWSKADQFRPERGAFHAWFFAVVRNRVHDELRRRSRRERLAIAGDVDELLAGEADPLEVEEEIARRERGSAVLMALRSLPPEQRRVVVLAYFGGGLSQSSIAEHLGWPLGTVKKRIRLGLQKLRAVLSEQGLHEADSDLPREWREAAHGL
jgi:RNA polymerase sigma-70 factor (ECF subfamily)